MSPAKKATTTKKTPAKKTTTKATTTKKAPAKAAATTKKAPAKKAPAKKAAATKKAPAKKAAPAAATKKAPAKKAAPAAATASKMTSAPTVGAPAPAFSLAGSDGATHTLAQYRGRPVVLFFYPKDNTPGCTVEACDFRDNLGRAQKAGAVVLGVSRDSLKSHDGFRAKFNLNYTLLSDPERGAHLAYGAWGKKVMYGKEVEGTIRSTFLIDAKGVLRQAWTKVKVNGHADEVISAVEAL